MVKLKLTLKSKHSSTVYAANGKSYRLQPGSNMLNLEYEDYLALAKSLGIKPVENKKDEDKAPEKEELKQEPVKEEAKPAEPEPVTEPAEEPVAEEPVKEDAKEEVDYSTWSYTKLKAEYKAITGKACKLKKDEVIAFLQEHNSNAE